MSNVNWIGRKTDTETSYIYCHWGGDLDQNGKILYENYDNEEKVLALLSEGDASYIDNTVEKCAFYATMPDRDEEKAEPTTRVNNRNRPLDANKLDLCFLWNDGQWWVSCGLRENDMMDWHTLRELMEDHDLMDWYERSRGLG